jgi:hypothetical protein
MRSIQALHLTAAAGELGCSATEVRAGVRCQATTQVAEMAMQGIRIWWRSSDPRPWAGSDFSRFFGGVLPRLRELTWLVDEQSFTLPDELSEAAWAAFDGRRRWIAVRGDWRTTLTMDPNFVTGPGFVPDYADWCNDDWNWMYGFDRPPADWIEWLQGRMLVSVGERAAHLERTVAVCFFAVDFSYWEFFAHDADLVVAAAVGAQGVAGLVVEPATLSESAGL